MRPALLLGVALVASALVPAPAAAETAPDLRIGMDIGSIDALKSKGATPDLAMFWLGAWNGDDPSGPATNWLNKAKANGVTPVIQWWYWGDKISPDCVQYGCDGRSQAQWDTAAGNIADAIAATMGGREVMVVIEPEFNKNGVDTWETFDGLWVEHAKIFHAVPGVNVVLSFGNWGKDRWGNFDRAAAEADTLGFQTMRGSTKTSLSTYQGTADSIAAAAKEMRDRFGRPSLLTDLALSTYPEPEYLRWQAEEVQEILSRADEYEAIGLRGIVYRSYKDSPGMSLENHFGEAERHWGLAWASNSTPKPAFQHWLAYATGGSPSPAPAPATPSFASSIEGEAMEHMVGGRSTDAAASGGYAWNLWANGDARATAAAQGTYDLVVRARGEPAAGVDAAMDVLVDGVRKATYVVPKGYAEYATPVDLGAGDHAVVVRFTNDHKDATGDRNLVVDKVELRAPAPTPGEAVMARALAAGDAVAGETFTVTYEVANVGGSDLTETFGVAADGAFASGGAKTLAPGATATVSVSLALPAGEHALEARMGADGATAVPGDGSSATVAVKRPGEARLAAPLAAPATVEAGKAFTASYKVTNVGETPVTQAFSVDAAGASFGLTTLTLAPGEVEDVVASVTLSADATLVAASDGAVVPGDGATAAVEVARPPFAATFAPKPGNAWWVEVKLDANAPLAGVSVSVNGGAAKALALKDWGAWAASVNAPDASKVVFTATATTGEKATSAAYRWPDATAYTEPAPAPFSWKKEAESAATKTAGGKATDGAASAGAAWNLWANGYVQDAFKAPVGGSYKVTAVAKGTSLGGVQAAFDLVVDGKVVGSSTAGTGYKAFSKTLTLGAGTHAVKVVFKNDAKSATEDRNLIVDVLTVEQL